MRVFKNTFLLKIVVVFIVSLAFLENIYLSFNDEEKAIGQSILADDGLVMQEKYNF